MSPKYDLIRRIYTSKRGDGSDPIKVQEANAYLDRAVIAGAITEVEKAEIMGV